MYRNAIQTAMNHLRTTITLFPQLLDLSQIVILNLIARKEFIQLIDIDRRRSYSLTTHCLIHFMARKSDRNQDLSPAAVAVSDAQIDPTTLRPVRTSYQPPSTTTIV